MMLEIIDLLYDRQGSDPVYEERFAGSRWQRMAISAASPRGRGHEQSGPVRIRTGERPARRLGRAARGAVRTRDLLALRFPAAGLRVPRGTGVRLRHRSRLLPAGRGRLRLRGPGLRGPVLRRSADSSWRIGFPRPRVRRSREHRGAAGFRGIRLPLNRRRRPRVPRPRRSRFRPVRLREPRPPAAELHAFPRQPGDLAGDRRPGSTPRHRPPAHRPAQRAAGRPAKPAAGRPAKPAAGRGCLERPRRPRLRRLPAGR